MTEGNEGAGLAAPDWYPDPEQPNTVRYWDGQQWTDQRAPAKSVRQHRPPAAIAGLIAAGCMALGAVGPWVDAVFVTVGGLNGDGVIVLIAAIVAAILCAVALTTRNDSLRGLGVGAILCGLIAAATSIYDLTQILGSTTELFGEDVRIGNPGWGLWLSAVASVGLFVSGAALIGSRKETQP
jgi:hypothetical protein